MICFKCDRCGVIEENHVISFATLVIYTDCEDRYQLCEQCYTTIMEVLKDGDIK